jgi:hypothetical protein
MEVTAAEDTVEGTVEGTAEDTAEDTTVEVALLKRINPLSLKSSSQSSTLFPILN